ncbi:Fur family transcriptional regulator [Corynebacterium lactis]|uniref:Fur family transcriptional regulator n=1 Tax=Corynebacterium lactis RW2-5 TaxID=1408189 RepID=A0A0K2H155_9CORY|nr:Fur family transcriptional regulator [Corynebacterium lactis]ALA67749.1 Fur family transcriptional regulator [Corynebacterium lactis RW2-5]
MVGGHKHDTAADAGAHTDARAEAGVDSGHEHAPSAKKVGQRIGQRSTRQRRAVVEIMRDAQNFRSAADIHRALTERGEKVGLTTVYRTLQSLAEIKAVDVLHQNNGEALYRLCGDHHHHHLVCTDCGETVEVTGGPVEEWAHNLAEKHGFSLTGHSAEVFGLCGNCQHSKD